MTREIDQLQQSGYVYSWLYALAMTVEPNSQALSSASHSAPSRKRSSYDSGDLSLDELLNKADRSHKVGTKE